MRIYKQRVKSADGTYKATDRWYLEFRWRGRVRHLAAFEHKPASRLLGEKIVRVMSYCTQGEPMPADLRAQIESLPASMHPTLMKWGLIDQRIAHGGRSLLDHLDGFAKALEARNRSAAHVRDTKNMCKRMIKALRVDKVSDIRAEEIATWLKEQRSKEEKPMSVRRSNAHKRAMMSFCRWMLSTRRASENPVGGSSDMQAENVDCDRRYQRRALEDREIAALLTATIESDKAVKGIAPLERYWAYRLAMETGLRRSELRALTVGDFRLDDTTPAVRLEAVHSKNKKLDELPLLPATASELKAYFEGYAPSERALAIPYATAEMLRVDLAAAGIKAHDEETGRTVDFHALRYTFVHRLGRAGVDVRMMKELARHSDLALTLNIYGKAHVAEKSLAIGRTAALAQPKPAVALAG